MHTGIVYNLNVAKKYFPCSSNTQASNVFLGNCSQSPFSSSGTKCNKAPYTCNKTHEIAAGHYETTFNPVIIPWTDVIPDWDQKR